MKTSQIKLLKDAYMKDVEVNGKHTTLGAYVRVCCDSDKDIVSSKECVIFDNANELVHAICVNEDMKSQADYPVKIISADYAIVQEIETIMSQKNFEEFLTTGYLSKTLSSDRIEFLKTWTRRIKNQAIQPMRANPYYTEEPLITPNGSNTIKRDDGIEQVSRPAKPSETTATDDESTNNEDADKG